jgi:hypothetical protein
MFAKYSFSSILYFMSGCLARLAFIFIGIESDLLTGKRLLFIHPELWSNRALRYGARFDR